VSPVKYELGFYIPEDDNLHSDRHEHLKSYKFMLSTTSQADPCDAISLDSLHHWIGENIHSILGGQPLDFHPVQSLTGGETAGGSASQKFRGCSGQRSISGWYPKAKYSPRG
jgi:hypothetical protein